MSLDNTSQPSVKYCADKVNANYIHGRPESELVPSRFPDRAIHTEAVTDKPVKLNGVYVLEKGKPFASPVP